MTQNSPEAVLAGIGAEMRAARARLGLSQAEVAGKVDVGRDTYSRYESAATPIPVVTLLRVAAVLGVSVQELTTPHGASLSHAA